jgi:hypothetical protein
MRSYRRLLALVPLLSIPLGAVSAQELWPGASPANFRLDLAKPSFDGGDQGFFTFTAMPMFRFKLKSLHVVADLPFASYAAGNDTEESDFRIGNPYLGVEARKEGSPFLLQFGGRIPLADEGDNGAALAVGLLSDWDHIEAWYPDLVPITASVVYERVTTGGLALGARLGGSGFFYTGDDSGDPDFLVNYGLRLGYEKDRAMVAAMFTGRWIATGDDDDSAQNMLGFEGGYRFGSVMPMLSFRLPVDDPLKETTNSVFGIGLKAWW